MYIAGMVIRAKSPPIYILLFSNHNTPFNPFTTHICNTVKGDKDKTFATDP